METKEVRGSIRARFKPFSASGRTLQMDLGDYAVPVESGHPAGIVPVRKRLWLEDLSKGEEVWMTGGETRKPKRVKSRGPGKGLSVYPDHGERKDELKFSAITGSSKEGGCELEPPEDLTRWTSRWNELRARHRVSNHDWSEEDIGTIWRICDILGDGDE